MHPQTPSSVHAPPFDLAVVNSAIAGTEFAGHLHHFAAVASTNSLAHAAAHVGARHGVWIADQQTAGRGRGGHTWHSAPGTSQAPAGLYMTALISPPIPVQSALHLSLTTAIAAQSAIATTFGFRIPAEIDIRWPNDLMLNGKKAGGILIETAAQPAPHPASQPGPAPGPAMLRYAIVGIGVNVNHLAFPPELDAIATSLRREMPSPAAPLPREPLAAAILLALDAEIRALETHNPQLTTHNLSHYSTWITGKRVRVEANGSDPQQRPASYTGVTAGLDAQGFLLVAGDDGRLHTVLSGGLREP